VKSRIPELRRKQNDRHIEAKTIHEKGVAEKRALTSEEEKAFGALMQEVDGLQREIEREERLALGGTGGEDQAPRGVGMSEGDLQKYSLLRAIRAQATGDWREAGLEREASDATAKRMGRQPSGFFVPYDWLESRHSMPGLRQAQSPIGQAQSPIGQAQLAGREGRAITPAVSGAIIQTGFDGRDSSFIDVLRNRLVVRAAGASFLTGLVGNLDLARKNTQAAVSWVTNGTPAPAESPFAIGAVPMRPKTASAYIDIYRSTFLQTSLDIEFLVRDDLAQACQLGLDKAALHGVGGLEPTGLQSLAGNQVPIGSNGGAPTWATMIGLETEVAADNADTGRLAYVTNPRVRGKLKNSTKTGGVPPFIWDDGTYAINGYAAYVSNQVRSDLTKGTGTGLSAIFFGNWSELIVGMWGGMDLTADIPDNRTGTVRVAAIFDADVTCRHPESFAVCLDALTT
jgi:HK97 family phage major capsid protein